MATRRVAAAAKKAAAVRKGKADPRVLQARYDAAGNGRRLAGWNPPTSGPIRAVEGTAKLLARARDSARNDWATESGNTRWTSTLIGVGIQPRWKDKALREFWDAFVPEIDADGVSDAYGQQALAVRAWLEGGECFLRERPRSLALPLSVPTQVQVLEAEQCPISLTTDSYRGLPVGNTIQQGIERNNYGRRVAYWFYKSHPGDKSIGTPNPDLLVRVPASEVSHVFEPKRPGQLRGVSDIAAVLLKLRNTLDFEDAVLDRQKLANLFAVFFTRSLPPEWDIEYDQDTGLPRFYDKAGNPIAGLEPGISQELNPGEDVKFANPPEAGTTYSEYMRSSHLGTAAGRNLPYELMTGDIQNVSDRTLRIVIQEFRRYAQQRQWHTVIHMICRFQARCFARGLALAGKIPVGRVEEAAKPEWAPHAWEYIHPVQDAQGKQTLKEMGVVSTSQLILERGDDPEKVFQQRADDQKTEKRLGISSPEPPAAGPGRPPGQPQPQPQPKAESDVMHAMGRIEGMLLQGRAAPQPAADGVDPAYEHFVQGLFARSDGRIDALAAAVDALAKKPIEVHVAPTPVEAHVHVPEGPAPVVNVEPTPVEAHVHVPEGPAPIVNVTPEVNVKLPDRRTETTFVDHDGEGNLKKVVQVETTIKH